MSNPSADDWLRNLAASLKASQQAACLWDVTADRYDFIGDTASSIDLDPLVLPRNKNEFARLLNPQDMVTRQLILADAVSRCRNGDVTVSIKYRMRGKSGIFQPILETAVAHYDPESQKTVVNSILSIDQAGLQEPAAHMRSTKVPDNVSYVFSSTHARRTLLEQIEEMLDDEARDSSTGFLLAVGIDRLSLINEAYGVLIADEVIMHTGLRLEKIVGHRATVARMSGDIFGVLFQKTQQGEMEEIAQSILSAFFYHPVIVGERSIHTVVSIGGVPINRMLSKGESALSHAEISLQEAKHKGRGCFVCYSEGMLSEVNTFRDALTISDDFLQGFKSGRVGLAFQSVRNSRTNAVSFYECLIRLVDKQGKVQPAGKFINAVEKMGLTRLVDGFCVRQAILELSMFPEISLSVNVSNHTLTDPQWLRDISLQLAEHPGVAPRLIIEITESTAMTDIKHTGRVIHALEDLGCKIALDDFGVGQTSFSQLKDLSLDIIKIDRTFIQNQNREENMLFIRALQLLASGMNIETVGEGAETPSDAELLANGGIDHIQGFTHGLPSMERLWLGQGHPERISLARSSI